MKRLFCCLLCVAGCSLFSCNKLKNITFNASYSTQFTVPAEPFVNVTDSVVSPAIATNISAVLKQNNTNPNLVKSVHVEGISFNITAPPGQTFSFINDMQVYIASKGLPTVMMANLSGVNNTGSSLAMNVNSGIDLKPYLLADSFNLKLTGTTGAALKVPATITGTLNFQFTADLLDALSN